MSQRRCSRSGRDGGHSQGKRGGGPIAMRCSTSSPLWCRLAQVIKYESVVHEFDPYFNFRVTAGSGGGLAELKHLVARSNLARRKLACVQLPSARARAWRALRTGPWVQRCHRCQQTLSSPTAAPLLPTNSYLSHCPFALDAAQFLTKNGFYRVLELV